MNLPLEWRDDKSLTQADFKPGRIVSLWDMLRFYAAKFLHVCAVSAQISKTVLMLQAYDNEPSTDLIPPGFVAELENFHTMLVEMELPVSAASAGRLINFLKDDSSGGEYDRLQKLSGSLGQRIIDELQSRVALLIPSGRASFYDKEGTILGKGVIVPFSDLEDDAIEAGKCFALGRYSACVFHLMRIMEHIVHGFATKMAIPFNAEDDSWGKILLQVPAKIKELEAKSSAKKKYNACYNSVEGLRPRRNGIMHLRDHYSEERAMSAMGAVKTCIEQYLELPDWESCPRSQK